MALPHLIKYVYTNGTDEVIRRGKKIHAIGYVEMIEYDELLDAVTFRVKDDSYSTYYKVNIQKFRTPKLFPSAAPVRTILEISAGTKQQP
jgi:non-specific serine/threonine protein kinase